MRTTSSTALTIRPLQGPLVVLLCTHAGHCNPLRRAVVLHVLSVRAAVPEGGDKTARFGKARTKVGGEEGGKKVTFADVAGADEEKAELQEVVGSSGTPRLHGLGRADPKGHTAGRSSRARAKRPS